MKFDPDKIALDVDGMSLEQEGAYMRCVRHIWRNGPLPEARLSKVCGNAWEAVKACAAEYEGGLSFSWLEDARTDAQGRSKRASIAGVASFNSRSTDVQQPFNGRSTDVLSISKSTSTSKSTSQEGKDATFESLWIIYDRYGAKAKALAYWKKLPQEDRDAITAIAPEYVASTPGCEYRKQLEGWINPDNRLWERPIIQKKGSATARALHSADVSPDAYSTQ